MAIVTFNPSIQGIHGSMGALVFYTSNGRTLLRSRGTVPKQWSPAQKAVRDAFTAAAACWRGLSREQREPWNARGRARGMTGYNLFQKVNIPRLKIGMPAEQSAHAPTMQATTAPAHVPIDAGCAAFMASIRAMVRRVNGECVRAGAA